MNKGMLMLSSLMAFSAYASDFVVIVDKESKYEVNLPPEVVEPEKSGVLINIMATGYEHMRSEASFTDTSARHWNEYYSETKDLAIVSITLEKNVIRPSGVINWFNPNQDLYVHAQKGCTDSDYAVTHVQYLDDSDNVIFWFKTAGYAYTSTMTYGKLADASDVNTTTADGSHPIVEGVFSFDKANNKVTYTKGSSVSAKKINDWELTNVDVNAIKKIKLVSSTVVADRTDGCLAGMYMWALKDGESQPTVFDTTK